MTKERDEYAEIRATIEEHEMYNGWAYTTDEGLKRLKNGLLYDKIKHLAKLERVSTGYGHVKYKVVDNPFGLSEVHLALIADEGNLCFGYRTDGSLIVIHTD